MQNTYRVNLNGTVHQLTTLPDMLFPYPTESFTERANWWNHDFLQLPQANLIVNPVPSYLTISSADRNRLKYPSTSQFTIKLVDDDPGQPNGVSGQSYRNIQSVKLLSSVIPNKNNVLDEAYLLLEIRELEGMYDACTRPSQEAFSKLYYQNMPGQRSFLRMDRGIGDPLTRMFWPTPKALLNTVSVAFRKYDGSLFDFGPDTGPEIDPTVQTNITLEIRTYIPDAKAALGHRNI